jgi:hypothetical protein
VARCEVRGDAVGGLVRRMHHRWECRAFLLRLQGFRSGQNTYVYGVVDGAAGAAGAAV